MDEVKNLSIQIQLLLMECEALRSVLAEYGSDHYHLSQWSKAQACSEMQHHIKQYKSIVEVLFIDPVLVDSVVYTFKFNKADK